MLQKVIQVERKRFVSLNGASFHVFNTSEANQIKLNNTCPSAQNWLVSMHWFYIRQVCSIRGFILLTFYTETSILAPPLQLHFQAERKEKIVEIKISSKDLRLHYGLK